MFLPHRLLPTLGKQPQPHGQTSNIAFCFCHCTPISTLSNTAAIMFAGRVAARSARVAAPRFQVAATRSFAEAAAKPAANVKPPVELFGVDGTYASALVWPI